MPLAEQHRSLHCEVQAVHFGCVHGCVPPVSKAARRQPWTEGHRLEVALFFLVFLILLVSRFSLCFAHLIFTLY